MKITKEMLRGWSACEDGYKWFLSNFPDGEAEYQDVLDALALADRLADAHWLMDRAGADPQAELVIRAEVTAKHIFAAGRLTLEVYISVEGAVRAGGGIEAGWGIKAGRSIKAGGGIEAGWGIKAGGGIEAGGGIKAGGGIEAGWGIKAGRSIKAGGGIEAGWGIKAGEGFGVFAGVRIRLSDWVIYAKVSAKTKPENLVSGHWAGE